MSPDVDAPVAEGRRNLLVVHQSAELYGSDRSLLELLQGIDRRHWYPIVCLPERGPLMDALTSEELEVHVLPVVKVSRSLFNPSGIVRLGPQVARALRGLDTATRGRRIDLVYSNTLAVWGGALWAQKRQVPHVWHVREIVERPWLVGWLMRRLAQLLSVRVICNSEQTRQWLDAVPPGRRSVVVWNGIRESIPPSSNERDSSRRQLGVLDPRPVILLLGRISPIKGQTLLLDAAEILMRRSSPPFLVVMVGGPPPGQPELRDALETRLRTSPAANVVQLFDFAPDVRRFFAAADVLAVPSRQPESFGRVAVEAMATGLPVVAAAHGGLADIVDPGRTGLLVPPNDAEALADALAKLAEDPQMRNEMGQAGRLRQQERFSLQAYRTGVWRVFEEALS